MQRLQRVLASSVLRALRARDHVVISAASTDAITDEMEAIIAPSLDDITPHLSRVSEAISTIDTDRLERADAPDVDRTDLDAPVLDGGEGDTAVRVMIDKITERLLASDHVDDIHADDRVLRRDTFRAIRRTLLGYIRGEIEVEEAADEDDAFTVDLDRLGYVVSSVARRLEPAMLSEALERAAASGEGELLLLDEERLTAVFDLPGGAEVSRLTVEEAITEELVSLVDSELVELPRIEQVLELEQGSCASLGFAEAAERAEARIRAETGSMASCTIVDAQTVVATFVPLSEEAAHQADKHFAAFLGALEQELSTPAASSRGRVSETAQDDQSWVDERAEPDEELPVSSRKRRTKKQQAPRSRPRGNKKVPPSQSSETRARAARRPKKTKRRNG